MSGLKLKTPPSTKCEKIKKSKLIESIGMPLHSIKPRNKKKKEIQLNYAKVVRFADDDTHSRPVTSSPVQNGGVMAWSHPFFFPGVQREYGCPPSVSDLQFFFISRRTDSKWTSVLESANKINKNSPVNQVSRGVLTVRFWRLSSRAIVFFFVPLSPTRFRRLCTIRNVLDL